MKFYEKWRLTESIWGGKAKFWEAFAPCYVLEFALIYFDNDSLGFNADTQKVGGRCQKFSLAVYCVSKSLNVFTIHVLLWYRLIYLVECRLVVFR